MRELRRRARSARHEGLGLRPGSSAFVCSAPLVADAYAIRGMAGEFLAAVDPATGRISGSPTGWRKWISHWPVATQESCDLEDGNQDMLTDLPCRGTVRPSGVLLAGGI